LGRRCLLARLGTSPTLHQAIPMATTAREEMQRFWERNERSNRPLSPHVSIYNWGRVPWQGPPAGPWGQWLAIPTVSPQAWDLGKGLKLAQVTQSGLLVLLLTLLSSAGLASL
ncbi:PREDICTED: succinate dehydrogenase cytochrome b560 subunit, mitochondrial, partial [Sturnus vulgaris]|uniref:succinate dehydrogenase cytochrome b560 subunit, mitochondrial n=1 Tax=Sturnus vulgaris TaxID=9172 RepID=UPI00071A4315